MADKSEAGWPSYKITRLMNWPVIPTIIARLEEQKKLPLRRRNSGSSSRRDHTHSLLVMILELAVFCLLLSKACQTLYQQVNVTIFVTRKEDHNLTQYEKGVATPVEYLVTGGASVSRSKTSDYRKVATLTQHSSRAHNKNPSSSNNKNNLKKIGPLKVGNMKDKYDYDVSGKSIDSEEEFLVNFDQDGVQGINFNKNFSEYERGESEIFVKGRLKNSFSFWQKIGASQNVLDTIANGYKIPFSSMPEPAELQNNRSATNNYDFVTASIDELVRTKRVVEVPFVPKVVNPLSVSTNKEKKR